MKRPSSQLKGFFFSMLQDTVSVKDLSLFLKGASFSAVRVSLSVEEVTFPPEDAVFSAEDHLFSKVAILSVDEANLSAQETVYFFVKETVRRDLSGVKSGNNLPLSFQRFALDFYFIWPPS
jgi:hypothetical protein